MIRGVIFDLWNTLIEVDGPKLVSRIATLINSGTASTPTEKSRPISAAEVTEYLRATGCLHQNVPIADIAVDLWIRVHGDVPRSDFAEIVRQEELRFVESARHKDGAQEVLDWVGANNLEAGIVSNASQLSLEVLDALSVRQAFTPDVWISCVSGYLKPDPRAFLTVAREWMLDPATICVVGDKISTDMFGARLSGMPAILLNEQATQSVMQTGTSIHSMVNKLTDVPNAVTLLGDLGDSDG